MEAAHKDGVDGRGHLEAGGRGGGLAASRDLVAVGAVGPLSNGGNTPEVGVTGSALSVIGLGFATTVEDRLRRVDCSSPERNSASRCCTVACPCPPWLSCIRFAAASRPDGDTDEDEALAVDAAEDDEALEAEVLFFFSFALPFVECEWAVTGAPFRFFEPCLPGMVRRRAGWM